VYQKNQQLKEELVVEKLKVSEYASQIAVLAQARADDQALILAYSAKINKVEKRYKDGITFLEKQKQKKKVLLSKPDMVTNRINAASKRLFLEFSCISGEATSCNDTSATANANNTD
jgi:hypothetical protein